MSTSTRRPGRVAQTTMAIAALMMMMMMGSSPALSATNHLPHPRTTLIVPGTSIGGVKLAMTEHQVFHQWGSTSCVPGVCTWRADPRRAPSAPP